MKITNDYISLYIKEINLVEADEIQVIEKLKEYLKDMKKIDYIMLMSLVEFVLYDLDAYNDADFMTIYKSIVIE